MTYFRVQMLIKIAKIKQKIRSIIYLPPEKGRIFNKNSYFEENYSEMIFFPHFEYEWRHKFGLHFPPLPCNSLRTLTRSVDLGLFRFTGNGGEVSFYLRLLSLNIMDNHYSFSLRNNANLLVSDTHSCPAFGENQCREMPQRSNR